MARRPSLVSPTPAPMPMPVPGPELGNQVGRKVSSRTGKRAVAFWIDDAAYEELKIAVARRRTTLQAAGEEMLDAWMRAQGMRLPS
jgi:hypothetical protein